MPPPNHAINTQRPLQLTKLEVKFLIVPLKRALIMTWQGQFACSTLQNGNDVHPSSPINYARQPDEWLVRGQTDTPLRLSRGHRLMALWKTAKSTTLAACISCLRENNKHVEKHGHTSMWESVHVSVCGIKLFIWGFCLRITDFSAGRIIKSSFSHVNSWDVVKIAYFHSVVMLACCSKLRHYSKWEKILTAFNCDQRLEMLDATFFFLILKTVW